MVLTSKYEPLVSLVMPVYKTEGFLKKAIQSILDQDYDKWQLTCVVNGEWGGRDYALKIINRFIKQDKRIQLLELKEGNVCLARNMGAGVSGGEILSFFSSDFYLFPGGIRKWVETFAEHPQADFVYSGYRLMKNGELLDAYVPSRPFDKWELEIEPYIDGGFPLKRQVYEKCKWDENIKSLNDWDFWLNVSRAGFNGYYMPDATYAAEMPREGGLSFDSHANWLDRVKAIKAKWKIPNRDICVVSLGAAPHAKKIAKILGADFRVAPQTKPHEYEMIYLVGFYSGMDGSSAVRHSQVFNGATNAKQVIHWIGSDILQLLMLGRRSVYADMKQMVDSLNNRINLTEFAFSQEELRGFGIASRVIPLPVECKWEIMPLPKKFTAAIYAPKTATASQTYNLDLMKDIAKSTPDIDFIFYGGGTELKAKNVENLEWVEMGELLAKSSVVLRICLHDGMPIAPIEFKMAGRDAITSVDMKFMYSGGNGVIHKDNYAERKEGLIKLLHRVKEEQKRKGYGKEAKEARAYYRKLNDPKKFKKAIYGLFDT